MRKILMLLLLLTTVGFSFPGSNDSLPNLYQPRDEIFTSGQPTSTGFNQLSDMGIRTVINVLPERDCIPGESGMVVSEGMKYYQVPFDPQGLNMESIHHFSHLLFTVDRPLLVHCSTGNHAGGMWMAYRVLIEHASPPQAIAEGRMIGMKPAMEIAVLRWLADPVSRAAKCPLP